MRIQEGDAFIKCLTHKCEDQSSDPQNLHTKTGMACNASTGERKTVGRMHGTGLSVSMAQSVNFRVSEGPCLKKVNE